MLNKEQLYNAENEYNEYQRLINTVEILTTEEKKFCETWDSGEVKRVLNYIGENRWLNINVYSEHDHEKKQFEYETGQ